MRRIRANVYWHNLKSNTNVKASKAYMKATKLKCGTCS